MRSKTSLRHLQTSRLVFSRRWRTCCLSWCIQHAFLNMYARQGCPLTVMVEEKPVPGTRLYARVKGQYCTSTSLHRGKRWSRALHGKRLFRRVTWRIAKVHYSSCTPVVDMRARVICITAPQIVLLDCRLSRLSSLSIVMVSLMFNVCCGYHIFPLAHSSPLGMLLREGAQFRGPGRISRMHHGWIPVRESLCTIEAASCTESSHVPTTYTPTLYLNIFHIISRDAKSKLWHTHMHVNSSSIYGIKSTHGTITLILFQFQWICHILRKLNQCLWNKCGMHTSDNWQDILSNFARNTILCCYHFLGDVSCSRRIVSCFESDPGCFIIAHACMVFYVFKHSSRLYMQFGTITTLSF